MLQTAALDRSAAVWLPSEIMETYIACFAGLLSAIVLAAVYLADRWEPEPIELIRNCFLSGFAVQLVVLLASKLTAEPTVWSGPWLLVTLIGGAVILPYHLRGQSELDERFDGIVYAVCFFAGAVCAIHVNNLPAVVASSPYGAAVGAGAAPDLRDLVILAGSGGFRDDLGLAMVAIAGAVLVGAVLGAGHTAAMPRSRIALLCGLVAFLVGAGDLLAGGRWAVRAALVVIAVGVAVAVKRRSIFRNRPQPGESAVLAAGLKTVLMILGAALLATVLLQAAAERQHSPVAVQDEASGEVGAP